MGFLKKLTLLAAAAAALISCSVCVYALRENDFEYEIKDGGAVITGYWDSAVTALTVPSVLGGNAVTEIDGYAFEFFDSMTAVTLPVGISKIGEGAFIECTALENVYFAGTKQQWEAIEIELDNEYLTNAKITFNYLTVPSGLKLAGRAADALRISWEKNGAADGYIVEMQKSGKWERIAKITNNSVTEWRQAGLSAGTAYNFRVKAYKMADGKAYYSGYTDISADTAPSKISGLKLAGRAYNALRFGWTKNDSADGYIVEMYKNDQWVRAAKITSNSNTEFKKSGLLAGTVYKFRIRSYKMSGKTALYSGYTEISARTSPSGITELRLLGKAKDALRIGWSKNLSADGYIVELYKDGKWVRAGKIADNAVIQFRKSGLSSGTTYKFRVKAYKMSGKTALYSGYAYISGTTK